MCATLWKCPPRQKIYRLMAKGAPFEREVAMALSKWWTHGERDDVFWRSSQSGGRATSRKKSGKSTFGQYGDIAATDPIGQPLLNFITFELKNGYEDAEPWRMMDRPLTRKSAKGCLIEQFVEQARRSSNDAGTPHWMVVVKRDRRDTICYVDGDLFPILAQPLREDKVRFDYALINVDSKYFGERLRLFGFHLETFLKLNPKKITEWQQNH